MCLLYLHVVDSIVTLSSSADSLCPGDGVLFTCVTDTGRLVWDIKNTAVSFHSSAYLNSTPTEVDGVFNVTLLSITGNTYYSTATAVYVPVSYNGTTVACGGLTAANKKTRTILIGWCDQSCCVKIFVFYRASTISFSQFDLLLQPFLCHHQLGSSTGHTPLCTQLHCHC